MNVAEKKDNRHIKSVSCALIKFQESQMKIYLRANKTFSRFFSFFFCLFFFVFCYCFNLFFFLIRLLLVNCSFSGTHSKQCLSQTVNSRTQSLITRKLSGLPAQIAAERQKQV